MAGNLDNRLAPRPAARAIVLHNNCLLVMRRIKYGKKYMVTPGGQLEPGEDHNQALLRELAEETMVTVANPQLVFVEEPNDGRWGTQYIYLCEYVRGKPQLHPSSEEAASNSKGNDLYEPMWIPLDTFPDPVYPFLSTRLGEEIAASLAGNFPSEPKRWTLEPPVVE